jgi:hypothetical protein
MNQIDIIKNIITECIEADAMFTLYDIIPEANERGYTLAESNIKHALSSFKLPAFYSKVNVKKQINNTLLSYTLYYPKNKDPFTYDDSDLAKIVKLEKVMHQRNKHINKIKTKTFNKDNRYSVPASIIREAGFKSGDSLYIREKAGRIVIGKSDILPKTKKIKRFENTVDCYNNLRIRKYVFQELLSDLPEYIKPIPDNGKIQLIIN